MPYPAYAFDLDGTLYRGESPIPRASEVLAKLRAAGCAIRFLTNNSGRTPDEFAEKLIRLGFRASPEEVITSATETARFCIQNGFQQVFVVGEPGLVAVLRAHGVAVVNALANGIVLPQTHLEGIPAVIVGICRHFDYALLSAAMQHIRSGARFIATNPDTTYPMEGDRLVPGAGSIVQAVGACSESEPTVIGKPKPNMVHRVLEDLQIGPRELLVVGDRYDTDILAGQAAGCPTHLVLTGITQLPPPGVTWSADLGELLADVPN